MQEDDSTYTSFQLLCMMKWDRISWDDPPDPSLELDLRRAEEELTKLVKKANDTYTYVYGEARFTVECDNFQYSIVALATPLLERRQVLAEGVNAASVIYGCLDEDVLHIIFDYAAEPSQDGYTFSGRRDLRNILPLASVTRKWRGIALASAYLWSSLTISHRSDCDVFRSFLERSKGGYLHIDLDMCSGWNCNMDQLVAQLRKIAHRVRTLHITAARFVSSPDYGTLFDFPFPVATAISIDSNEFPSLLVPALSHLRAGGQTIQSFSSNFGSVTFMELSDVSVGDVLSILPLALQLKALKVTASFGDLIDARYMSNPFVHAGIDALDTNHGSLIDCLTLPNLKSLVLLGDRGTLREFLQRSGCGLTRFGIKCYSDDLDIDIVVDTPTVTELYLEVGALAHCGAVFHQLNERLDPKGRVRSITLHVDDHNESVWFESAHPYLFAPFLTYYSANSNKIDRISIKTPRPHEFLRMWSGLYRSMPAVISLNDYPLAYFRVQEI